MQTSSVSGTGSDANCLVNRAPLSDFRRSEDWYTRAADAEDSTAMLGLGLLFEEQDPAAARDWYERAAEAGNDDAMVNLGVLLQEQDPAAARSWYERAASARNTTAMCNLAGLLATLDPPDVAGARAWWTSAADGGNAVAMVNLSPLVAIEGDINRARMLLQEAARHGIPAARDYAVTLDDDGAVRAAGCATLETLSGDSDALNFLGVAALRSGTADEARALWTRSADAGDLMAPILLGVSGVR